MEYQEAYKEAIEKGLSEEEAKQEAKHQDWHTFNLPEEFLWENIRKNVATLPETLSKALKKIAELNPDLQNVVDSVDFIQFIFNLHQIEKI